ncbi:hypothetical protein FDP41_010056 [Naegleria fowleri]|uniref:Uncharacterized protein n=1 Tax=Naegleria fowleri TaxID=5763 RepID=A0A6A5AU45_NAEFO|nr:uncharacterized protein FDP41_010056 [Naegleria fowleri]KAF0971833.1 hypothetical protein FDP41_010056 [Naegleria fowleri]
MSKFLAELYGSPSSSDDEEYASSNDEFMSMEEQRALYRSLSEEAVEESENEDVDDDPSRPSLSATNVEELISSGCSAPKKASFKNQLKRSKSRKRHSSESKIIIEVQEQVEEKDDLAPIMDRKWNSIYENHFENFQNRGTMIRKLPLQYVELEKMSFEKVSYVSDDFQNHDIMKEKSQTTVSANAARIDSSILIACPMMPYIFYASGVKDGKEYPTFIAYDSKVKKWSNFTEIYYGMQERFGRRFFNFIPAVNKDTILVSLGDALFCFDFHTSFILCDPDKFLVKEPHNELSHWRKTSLSLKTKEVVETTNHSYSYYGNRVWIFGGRNVHSGVLTNQLVECTIAVSPSCVKRERIYGSDPPLPRENHAQCQIGNDVYIYGGNYMKPHQLLNDLHVFNTMIMPFLLNIP